MFQYFLMGFNKAHLTFDTEETYTFIMLDSKYVCPMEHFSIPSLLKAVNVVLYLGCKLLCTVFQRFLLGFFYALMAETLTVFPLGIYFQS